MAIEWVEAGLVILMIAIMFTLPPPSTV